MLLIHKASDALIQVETENDTLTAVHAPTCGTCCNYSNGRCRSAGKINPKVGPDDISCTNHRWERGHARLVELTDALRRDKTNEWHIRSLNAEFAPAEKRDVDYFESIKHGERPPVTMATTSNMPPVPKRVNSGPAGEKLCVAWPNPQNAIRNTEWKPLIEFQ